MPLSVHDTTVATFRRLLEAMDRWLILAEENARTRGFAVDALLAGRLAPDMFPLTRQIQIACDLAKAAGARLAGLEVPRHEDNETTVSELRARIARVIGLLDQLDPAAIEAGADRHIQLSVQGQPMEFSGADYVSSWALPNFYFHFTTAYNLLRMQGVPLGKRDYLART